MIRNLLGRFVEYLLSYDHEVKVILGDGASMPFHKYNGDAGYDLITNKDIAIPAKATVRVPSGIYIDPKDQIWMELKARSSTLKNRGLEVVDAVIDQQYRGEMMAVVFNPKATTIFIKAGERIVQIIPHRLIPLHFTAVTKLSESPRGNSGFGSTGTGI